MTSKKKPETVSLVLGSGGARGLAHIGVIRYLEELGYRIESIAGSSMGALIGGMYATGKLDEFERWIGAIDRTDIVSMLDLSLEKGGFVKGDRIIGKLKDLLGETHIEELDIRFTAVATDISRRKEIWISKGLLIDAIRASISIPLLFTPVRHRGRLMVDGGVLNPVPIAPVFSDDTDLIIAVNADASPEQDMVLAEDEKKRSNEDPRLHERVLSYLEELKSAVLEQFRGDWRIYDVALQSFEAMQGTIARQKLAAYPPDVLIEVPGNICRSLDFHLADKIIPLGYELAKQQLARAD